MDAPREQITQQRLEACRDTVRKLRAEVEVARSCEEDAKCMTATIYAELERLREERRWHDARTEDKPYGGPTDMYLITNGDKISLGYFDLGDQWWDLWEGMHHNDITHWMPLPEPPKEK